MGAVSSTLCHVLREAPELAECVPEARRARAIEDCVAAALRLAPGPWSVQDASYGRAGVGLLVLEGLLIRRVVIGGRSGAELLGEGDLISPWQLESDLSLLPLRADWSINEPTRLAVLDSTFMASVTRYPEIVGALLSRSIERNRNLAVQLAIIHQARVDVRLHMLLWHLATRWGRVRSDATVLPVRLTHTVLADLVAARRPTVTSALTRLARQGLVQFDGELWVLSGDPPAGLPGSSPAGGQSLLPGLAGGRRNGQER